MKVLRTPDECFADLPGYGFPPHYTEVASGDGGRLRIHHFEAGPKSGKPVLLLHGQPTWGYLYRKMAPVFARAGYRVIAPDFVGFGRSDKPAARENYTYANHVRWMREWFEAQNLHDLTLFCQDWGGLIGLRLVAAYPRRFARVAAANTFLPDGFGQPPEAAKPMRELYAQVPVVSAAEIGPRFAAKEGPPGFFFWRKYCAESPAFSVGDVVQHAVPGMGAAVRAAYEAPFPAPEYMAGARQFPSLVPIFPDDVEIPANKEAWKVLERFENPFFTCFAADDAVSAGLEQPLQTRIPGAKGVAHKTIQNAGHFLQESRGETVAEAVLEFMRAHPLR